MNKTIVGITLLVFFLAALAPMFNVSAKPTVTTITFWHTMNDEETTTLKSIIADFETANSDIKVELVFVDFWEAHDQYLNTFTAGDTPDVFRSEIMWTPEWADDGRLEDLSSLYTTTEWADFLSAPLGTGKYNGKQYGVPQVTDCLALVYNKHQCDAAEIDPTTFSSLTAFKTGIATLGENHSTGQYGFTIGPMTYWYFPFMWGKGGNFFDGDYTAANIAINSSGSVAGLEFLKEIIDMDETPAQALQLDYGAAVRDFKYGNVSMAINGPWQTADYLSGAMFNATEYVEQFGGTAPDWVNASNFGIATIPGDTGTQGSPVGGHNYVIAKSSEAKEEAKKFVKYLTSVETNVRFALANNLLPVRKEAYNNGSVQNNTVLQAFKGQLEKAQTRAVVPYWGDLDGALSDELTKFFNGDQTAEKALDNAASRWATIITGWKVSSDTTTQDTPGFELLFAIAGMALIAIVLRKRKNKI